MTNNHTPLVVGRCSIAFDNKGGISLDGDEEAVRRAYEIWNPFNSDKAIKQSDQYRALKAENERLREALQDTAEVLMGYETMPSVTVNLALYNAKQALEESGGE